MNASVIDRPCQQRQGAFLIPVLNAAIPKAYDGTKLHDQFLARFALAADGVGVPLPGGEYVSMKTTVCRQWQEFHSSLKTNPAVAMIKVVPEFRIEEKTFEVRLKASPYLSTIRLKPVIEKLESYSQGLGWFVVSTLNRAHQYSMPMYDMTFLADEADSACEGAKSDDEYANLMLGDDECPPGEPVPQAVLDGLLRDYNVLPSTYIDQAGGHAHLVGLGDKSTEALALKPAKVLKVLGKGSLDSESKECVSIALQLAKEFSNSKGNAFEWCPYAEAHDSMDEGFDDPYYEPPELVGAVAFVVWDKCSFLLESVEHHEQNVYNGGVTTYEAVGHKCIPLDAGDDQLKQLARELRAYLQTWSLLDKLLSMFPIADDEDE